MGYVVKLGGPPGPEEPRQRGAAAPVPPANVAAKSQKPVALAAGLVAAIVLAVGLLLFQMMPRASTTSDEPPNPAAEVIDDSRDMAPEQSAGG